MANNFPTIRPSLNLQFAGTGVLPPDVTFTRASSSGGYYDGKTVVKAEENLLLNSATMVTQNVTTRAEAYTLSFTGTGTVTLSGTSTAGPLVGTGATDRVVLTFTPTAGTLTLTVSGSVTLAQLEARSSATAYTPTTTQPITKYIPKMLFAPANVPVFDHNPVTGEALGLSVWEARTNLLLRSQEFDNAYWTKTNASVTADQIIAPDGTLTADKLVEDTANSAHLINKDVSGIASGATVTYSIFVKAAERNQFRISRAGGAVASAFNLSTLTVTNAAGSTGFIVPVGNGVFRVGITFAILSTSTNVYFELQTTASVSSQSYLGDGTSGIYIWGAQLEQGAFPTPYIPTVASTVARSADVAVMTGANFSRWFNPAEGALFADFTDAVAGRYVFTIRGAGFVGDKILNWTGGAFTSPDGLISSTITTAKRAISYQVNSLKMATNGTLNTEDATVTNGWSDSATMVIGASNNAGSSCMNGYVKSLSYYPTRLTNAQLQAVTA
jgi:hypothetical protein